MNFVNHIDNYVKWNNLFNAFAIREEIEVIVHMLDRHYTMSICTIFVLGRFHP